MKALHIIVIGLVVALNLFINIQSDGEEEVEKTAQPPVFLSIQEAQARAYQGFMKNVWALPPQLVTAMTKTKVDVPLLVQRTDRKDYYCYYIVPFNQDGKTAVVVLIDARSGDFKETSAMATPAPYPAVKEEEALGILTAFLKKNGPPTTAKMGKPRLVFEPCQQTQSPYEPLWKIQVGSSVWFVDQLGKVYDKILPPKLKGGGF